MEEKKYKRKQIIVDKAFQAKFVFNVYIMLAILLLLLAIMVIIFTSQEMSGSVYAKIITMKNIRQVIMPLVLRITFALLIVAFAVISWRFLRLSHRIAGPIYRFKKSLELIKKGNLCQMVKIRKHDELQDVAELFCGAITSLNKKVKMIKKNSDSLKTILKQKKIAPSDINKIRKYQKEIEKTVGNFKV
ncbi:MAG: methyl-accepting chemotaxis protein [Spirochaetes bacterium]|nr:methyl-accepting chemotaxis protein [Spirochaetota bacterium]